jgi:hypothetical protein
MLKRCPEAEVLYCDTLAYEHPDNLRFLQDCERWYGKSIIRLKSEKYEDIYDVFDKTRWLVGVGGARCTTELKKIPRKKYQRPGDVHVFGFTSEESDRASRFMEQNPGDNAVFPLIESGTTKQMTLDILRAVGIKLPAMYMLGYKNNNCVGCVKGQAGYWNKVRRDFPEAFNRMAAQERKLDAAINKVYRDGKRVRVFLDELDPNQGRYESELDWECGVLCPTKEDE